jgi:hypothetical protein
VEARRKTAPCSHAEPSEVSIYSDESPFGLLPGCGDYLVQQIFNLRRIIGRKPCYAPLAADLAISGDSGKAPGPGSFALPITEY